VFDLNQHNYLKENISDAGKILLQEIARRKVRPASCVRAAKRPGALRDDAQCVSVTPSRDDFFRRPNCSAIRFFLADAVSTLNQI
jgi:hypothetical protein